MGFVRVLRRQVERRRGHDAFCWIDFANCCSGDMKSRLDDTYKALASCLFFDKNMMETLKR